MSLTRADRPIPDLLRDLSRDTSTLFRQEIALAKAEIGEQAATVAKDAVWIGVGAVLLHLALLVTVAAMVLGLIAVGMVPWLAAVVVAASIALIGGGIVATRVATIRRRTLIPVHTVDSLKETAQWLKQQTQ